MENHIFKKSDGELIWSSSAAVPIELNTSDYIHKQAELDLNYSHTWDSTKEEIVKGNLKTVDPAVVEAETKLAYRGSRKNEYPDIGDQLDDLYQKGAFSTEMTAQIKAVKDKYPKS